MGDKELAHETAEEIRDIVSAFDPVPVLLLADSEDLEQIVLALECGVSGYVPSSVGIAICAEAIRLAMAGGRYVPVSSIMAMRNHIKRKAQSARPLSSMFTQRQAEVVQALRKGKANKIIAYELDMRESTVKVHIRNIMKKVKATNRTEVAYKINEMFPEMGDGHTART
jgi:DNA-binding NarL/FixJ family response regulator